MSKDKESASATKEKKEKKEKKKDKKEKVSKEKKDVAKVVKSKDTKKESQVSKAGIKLLASKKSIDPSLASLFSSSAGPVERPKKEERVFPTTQEGSTNEDDEELSSADEGEDLDNADVEALTATEPVVGSPKSKKRKHRDEEEEENEGLEGRYLQKLVAEETKAEKKAQEDKKEEDKKSKEKKDKKEKKEKKEKQMKDVIVPIETEAEDEDMKDVSEAVADEADSDEEEDSEVEGNSEDSKESDDGSDEDNEYEDGKEEGEKSEEDPDKPKHESLEKDKDNDIEKSARTVFLGNVPSSVATVKADKKTLKSVFEQAGPIASIRFRSIAFSEQIPRKAAFVTKKFHEKQTTLNAYIVYETVEGARKALKLNGAVVLDRHIRVDSVAHPAEQDPKRCVFVGNLDFEAQEEKLWRYFAQCGKVESVRIIRDSKTNVGKGFAYVQFVDENAVEKALLLNDKKPEPKERKLRVVRAKKVKRRTGPTATDAGYVPKPKSKAIFNPKVAPKQASNLGRAQKLIGKAGAAQLRQQVKVFEGLRATNATESGVKKAPKARKPNSRDKERAAAYKKKMVEKAEAEAKAKMEEKKKAKAQEKASAVRGKPAATPKPKSKA